MTRIRTGQSLGSHPCSKASMARFFAPQASCILAAASLFSMHGTAFAQLNPDAFQTIPSLPLATFQDSLGVNTHIEYTDGKYADAAAVLSDLQFLGIHNLRDGIPDPIHWLPPGQALDAMHMLAAKGMHFDFAANCNTSVSAQMQQLDALEELYPGIAISVEGTNEINNAHCNGGGGNEQAAETFQKQLYSAVHADAHLSGVPVLYFTGGAPMNLQTHPGFADLANAHPYSYHGDQPLARILSEFAADFTMTGNYPKAITEAGYATLPVPADPDGVDEPAQAELILNTYFDAALQGVSHTYIYQLLDPYTDAANNDSDKHFGFFHLDNSPKIAAYAMRHLADILPPDKPSAAQTVQAAITGLPSTAHTFALTGSDGSVALFLWNEVPVWNADNQSLHVVDSIPVQVQMNGSWTVSYFTPAADTTYPLQAANGQYTMYLASYPTALIFKKK